MENNTPNATGKSGFDLIDAEKLLATLPIAKDSVILDAGCGAGAYTLAMAPLCPHGVIYAFDHREEGIDRLCQAAADANFINIIPSVINISFSIPLNSSSVDLCLITTALHDLISEGTADKALREVQRVLKPDGLLAVIEFEKRSGQPSPPLNSRISPVELDELLRQCGFIPARESVIDLGEHASLAFYQPTE